MDDITLNSAYACLFETLECVAIQSVIAQTVLICLLKKGLKI